MHRNRKLPRIAWRELHGIVLFDKHEGESSTQAMQSVRRVFRAAKGGHTGALDPMATGLLPLCFGEATKLAGNLLGARKAYRATCRLGITTSTADREGEILLERPVPALDAAAIEAALAPLRGRITQVPPVYSALKQDGEALYVKARRGDEVTAPPREVEVFRLELLAFDADSLTFEVECGSGTYVRALARDLGEALGCGAHLTALRRLWVEPFRAPVMATMAELEQAARQGDAALLAHLLPLSAGLADWPVLPLDEAQTRAIVHGQPIVVARPAGRYAAYAADGALLALLELDGGGRSRIQRGFNLPPP